MVSLTMKLALKHIKMTAITDQLFVELLLTNYVDVLTPRTLVTYDLMCPAMQYERKKSYIFNILRFTSLLISLYLLIKNIFAHIFLNQ